MKDKKVILISGCGSGIGKIAAQALSVKGYEVYAGIRKEEELSNLRETWKVEYPTLHPIKLDITYDKECQEVVRKILSKENHIDVLINIAGYTLVGPADGFNSDNLTKILDTNTVGAFRLIKAVLPSMKKRKSGKIINLTSLNGLVAFPNFGFYSASKFALEALGRALRFELAPFNIWVTNIAPGAVHSSLEIQPKSLPHKPAREKFWILRLLLPMISDRQVVESISKVVDQQEPPMSLCLGIDAVVVTALQRFLPQWIWEKIMIGVWTG